jgi:RecA-family ATPase
MSDNIPQFAFPFSRLQDWLEQAEESQAFLLQDLVPEEALVILSGTPKRSKKTLLMLNAAMALATGKPIGKFIPTNPEGVPILICEGEGSTPGMKQLWDMLLCGANLTREELGKVYWLFREPLKINYKEHALEVVRFVEHYGVKCVVFDTLNAHASFNENNSQEVGALIDMFNKLKNKGCSIILVHHLNKPSKDFTRDIDDELRGSSALAGAYDVHFAIRQKSDESTTLDLHVRSKYAEDKLFHLRWHFMQDTYAQLEWLDADSEGANEFDMLCISKLMPTFNYSRKKLSEMWGIQGASLEKQIRKFVEGGLIEEGTNGYLLTGGQ